MKTSELIQKLRESEYARYGEWKEARQRVDRFTSLIINDDVVAQFSPIGQWLYIFEDCPKDVRLLLSEYTSTPLEEREEEKKYRLHLHSGFAKRVGYLNLNTETKEYFFDSETEYAHAKTSFTQKEINTMPAFTAWLLKEEVK